MTQTGIVWSGESAKYQQTRYTADQIVPPPFWAARFPDGYTADNIPNIHDDEHFQVWMRTAGLPTFRCAGLAGAGKVDPFAQKAMAAQPGRGHGSRPIHHGHLPQSGPFPRSNPRLTLRADYPVVNYSGTKSVVFSTVSWMGGRNPFLGIAYIVVAGLCILIGLALLLRHVLKPRKLGDMSFLRCVPLFDCAMGADASVCAAGTGTRMARGSRS
jgi:hypothetical protein